MSWQSSSFFILLVFFTAGCGTDIGNGWFDDDTPKVRDTTNSPVVDVRQSTPSKSSVGGGGANGPGSTPVSNDNFSHESNGADPGLPSQGQSNSDKLFAPCVSPFMESFAQGQLFKGVESGHSPQSWFLDVVAGQVHVKRDRKLYRKISLQGDRSRVDKVRDSQGEEISLNLSCRNFVTQANQTIAEFAGNYTVKSVELHVGQILKGKIKWFVRTSDSKLRRFELLDTDGSSLVTFTAQ